MDELKKVGEIVEKLKGDENLMNEFTTDPVKTLEGILGVDLPDDKIEPLIEAVKAKLHEHGLSEIVSKIEGFFKKKA